MSPTGLLLVVATPIGNLGDVSERTRESLATADLILAEDTRRTKQLLRHLGIDRPLASHHRFNEAAGVEAAIARLEAGETLALVSDAGTPSVSDPGTRLVAAALERGLRVEPRPGPTAVVAALSVSGLPADRFSFAGFLPQRRAGRLRELRLLARRPDTLVFFEAPHRVVESVRDMADVLGRREAVLCRELTKHYEEVLRRPLPRLAEELAGRTRIQGEIVLVVEGSRGPEMIPSEDDPKLSAAWKRALEEEQHDPRRALKRLSRSMGLSRLDLRRRLEGAGLFGEADDQDER